jgi:hypothetical protein
MYSQQPAGGVYPAEVAADPVAEAHIDKVLASLNPEYILKLTDEYKRGGTEDQRKKILQTIVNEQASLEKEKINTIRRQVLDNLISGIIFFIRGYDIQASSYFDYAQNVLQRQMQVVEEKELLLGLVYIFLAMVNKRVEHSQKALKLFDKAYAIVDGEDFKRIDISGKGINLQELRAFCNKVRVELLDKQLSELELTAKESQVVESTGASPSTISKKGEIYYALWSINSNPENLLRAKQYWHPEAIITYSKVNYGEPKDEKQLGIAFQYYQTTIISLLQKRPAIQNNVIEELVKQLNTIYLQSLSSDLETGEYHKKVMKDIYGELFLQGVYIPRTVSAVQARHEKYDSDLFFLQNLHDRFTCFLQGSDQSMVTKIEEILKRKNEEIIALDKQILDCNDPVQIEMAMEKIRYLKKIIGLAEYRIARYHQNKHDTGNAVQWLLGIESRPAFRHLMSAATKFCQKALPDVIAYHDNKGNILRAYLWSMNYFTKEDELIAATVKYQTLLKDTLKDRYKHRNDAIAYCVHLIESGEIKPGANFLYTLYSKITDPNVVFPAEFLEQKELIINRLLKDLKKEGLVAEFSRYGLVSKHYEDMLQKKLRDSAAKGEEFIVTPKKDDPGATSTDTAFILQRVQNFSLDSVPATVVVDSNDTEQHIQHGGLAKTESQSKSHFKASNKKLLPKVPPLRNQGTSSLPTSPIVDLRSELKH